MKTVVRRLAAVALRSVIARLALAGLGGALLAGTFFTSPSESAGPYNLNGRVSAMHMMYDGVCEPGTLQTELGAAGSMLPSWVNVSSSTRFCFATQDYPGSLIAGTELLGYASVAAMASLSADMTAVSLGTVTVQNIADQPDFSGNFPASGQFFIDDELVSYSSKTATGFVLSSRGDVGGSAATTHSNGALIRAQGRLKVLTRGQKRYPGGGTEALTQIAPHAVGTAISSAKTYLTCRSRLDQTSQPGNDAVTARMRCYATLEPGETGSSAPYWADPYPGPILAMTCGKVSNPCSLPFTHDILTGSINDTASTPTTPLSLSSPCVTYIENFLYLKATSTITVDKTPFNTESGTFRVSVYTTRDCTGSALATLGGADGNNVQTTQIADTDTDGDGCSDYQELGSTALLGGLRDPFSRWDFFDPYHPNNTHSIDLFNDIFGVAFKYGFTTTSPGYSVDYDRGAQLGPNIWNLAPPNGNIDLFNDIFNVAGQYGHHC